MKFPIRSDYAALAVGYLIQADFGGCRAANQWQKFALESENGLTALTWPSDHFQAKQADCETPDFGPFVF